MIAGLNYGSINKDQILKTIIDDGNDHLFFNNIVKECETNQYEIKKYEESKCNVNETNLLTCFHINSCKIYSEIVPIPEEINTN